jgi:NADPH2:quinone reductase
VEAINGGCSTLLNADTYAEAIVAEAERLIPLPDGLSFEQGAAFPLQGMTAHYLLHEFRRLGPGSVVLVQAAAGGMGGLLVQWAKHLGATVIGTVSTEAKARTVRASGADHVILYTEQDFVTETKRITEGRGADLIIDGVGKTTFNGDLEAAAVRGHIVIFGATSGPADPVSPNALMPKSLTVSGGMLPNYLRTAEELQRRANDVLAGIRAGWLQLKLGRVLPLAQAAQAHELLENRKTEGKLVLTLAD